MSLIIPCFSVAVVVSFFLCWSPFHAQRLMFVLVTLLGRWDTHLATVQHHIFMVSGKQIINHFKVNTVMWKDFFITSTASSTQFCTLSCLRDLEENSLIYEETFPAEMSLAVVVEIASGKHVFFQVQARDFLAPKGAQEVAICVCLSIPLITSCLCSWFSSF